MFKLFRRKKKWSTDDWDRYDRQTIDHKWSHERASAYVEKLRNRK